MQKWSQRNRAYRPGAAYAAAGGLSLPAPSPVPSFPNPSTGGFRPPGLPANDFLPPAVGWGRFVPPILIGGLLGWWIGEEVRPWFFELGRKWAFSVLGYTRRFGVCPGFQVAFYGLENGGITSCGATGNQFWTQWVKTTRPLTIQEVHVGGIYGPAPTRGRLVGGWNRVGAAQFRPYWLPIGPLGYPIGEEPEPWQDPVTPDPTVDPIALPPGVPAPVPSPTPWPLIPYRPWQRPDRSPTEQPQRGPRPGGWPWVRPGQPAEAPEPLPAPNPRPGPKPAPGPSTGPAVPPVVVRPPVPIVRPGVRPSATLRPPGPRTKERKVRVGNLSGLLRTIYDAATEAADFIDALWWALPAWARSKPLKNADGSWRSPPPQVKAQDIYRHFGDMNIQRAMTNVLLNELGDRMAGSAGNALRRANQAIGHLTPGGFTLGRGGAL